DDRSGSTDVPVGLDVDGREPDDTGGGRHQLRTDDVEPGRRVPGQQAIPATPVEDTDPQPERTLRQRQVGQVAAHLLLAGGQLPGATQHEDRRGRAFAYAHED